MMRLGCSWLASLAASMDSSKMESLSGTMIIVKTRPIVTMPADSRMSSSFLLIAVAVVSGKSTIICATPHRWPGNLRGSRPPPFPAGSAQHLERRLRAPGAGLVGIGFAVRRPVFQSGIEYPQSQFDFFVDWKQGGLAE